LQTWLVGSVNVGWGRKGRPADLGDDKQEVESTIDHLLKQGNCQKAGESGHEMVRLVRPVVALAKKVEQLREIERYIRHKTELRLRNGNWVGVAEALPSSWRAQTLRIVGKRFMHAIEQTVVEGLRQDPAYQARTVEHQPGEPIEEFRLILPNNPGSLDDKANQAGDSKTGDTKSVSPGVDQQAGQGERVAQVPQGKLQVIMIPVSWLRANTWNPNTMTEVEQNEVNEEVRRKRGPAKPILVRYVGDHAYEILDGEHNWIASQKAGHTEVPCEVVKVDDFEAMRLTFVRTQHGTRDALRTGKLFRRMLDLRGMALDSAATSQRAFARENNINEATLRNYLLYADAAEVRKRYAPETADETIGNCRSRRFESISKCPRGGATSG